MSSSSATKKASKGSSPGSGRSKGYGSGSAATAVVGGGSSSSSSKKAKSSSPSSSSSTHNNMSSGAGTSGFTAEMRDRQARGQDPYSGGYMEDSDYQIPSGHDTYPADKEREYAAQVLADREMLMMWAISRNDSMAGTQLYFTRKLYGMPEPPPPAASSAHSGTKSGRSRRSGSHH